MAKAVEDVTINILTRVQALDKFVGFHVNGTLRTFGADMPVTVVHLERNKNQITDLGILPEWVCRFSRALVIVGDDEIHAQFARAAKKLKKPFIVFEDEDSWSPKEIRIKLKNEEGFNLSNIRSLLKLSTSKGIIINKFVSVAMKNGGIIINYYKSIHDKGSGITADIDPQNKSWAAVKLARFYVGSVTRRVWGLRPEIYITHNPQMTLACRQQGLLAEQIEEVSYPLTTRKWRGFVIKEARDYARRFDFGKRICVLFTRGPVAGRSDDPDGQVMPSALLRELLGDIRDAVARTAGDMHFLIKPHPNQSVEDLRAILEEVGLPSWEITFDPPALLCAVADLVITNYSSTCIEAKQFGAWVIDYYRETPHFWVAHPAGNKFGKFGVVICRTRQQLEASIRKWIESRHRRIVMEIAARTDGQGRGDSSLPANARGEETGRRTVRRLVRRHFPELEPDAALTRQQFERMLAAEMADLPPEEAAALKVRLLGKLPWVPPLEAAVAPSVRRSSAAARVLAQIDTLLESPSSGAQDEILGLMRGLAKSRSKLPFRCWLMLYGHLIRAGCALAAWEAKRIAARKWLDEHSGREASSFPKKALAVAAAQYLDDHDMGQRLLDQLRDGCDDDARRREVDRLQLQHFVVAARFDEARACFAAMPESALPEHAGFRELLNAKRVALVGPSVNSLRSGAEIDAHDLVVRPNFKGTDEILAQSHMVGSRTDISYYNHSQFSRFKNEISDSLRDHNCSYIVTRSPEARKKIVENLKINHVRDWILPEYRVFFGFGYAFRHILADFALFEYGSFKIFGADLFLGEKVHYAGYWSDNLNVPMSYVRHDVFDCFRLFQRCWRAGLIEADAVLSRLLELDMETFCQRASERCLAQPAEAEHIEA